MSGTSLKEDISKRSMLNPQSTSFFSPLRSTGSLLVPRRVSRSTISHTRSSSTSIRLHLTLLKYKVTPRGVTTSHQLQSLHLPRLVQEPTTSLRRFHRWNHQSSRHCQ